MSKHTPGPWHIAGDSDGTMITANFAKQIALWPPQSGEIEQCANARLIAAAPDLLYIASWIEKECEEGDGTIPDGLYNSARAAIKKATGGQP